MRGASALLAGRLGRGAVMRWLIRVFLIVILAGVVGFWLLTRPETIPASQLPAHTPDLANGERMFHAGGCAACHAAPASAACDDPKLRDRTRLAGGRCLKSPFGTFYASNISPDRETGIGGWSDIQFVNAMMRGIAPDGGHYYPAFPYVSYQRMRYADVLDLKAYLDTLPAVRSQVPDHDLALPFQLRRGLGLWKWLFLDGRQFVADPAWDAKLARGAYLVEGPGHCGACHTPRTVLGGRRADLKLAGGPAPEGSGHVPNITPHASGIGDWSENDIAYFLETGFTPSFDAVGGTMAQVQENMARLTPEDRAAIAAYLTAVPPIESVPRPKSDK